MTLLVGGLALLLAAAFSAFSVMTARVSSLDARAQLAADAAALAAAAESAPYGAGDPETKAAAYARANGAELASCDCVPGSTSFQVSVRVGGATAAARAVIDPEAFAPAVAPATRGLHPSLEVAVRKLIARSQGTIQVVSGWRSPQDQIRLWTQALSRYGSPEVADDWVARPGSSMHERGLAVDLGGDIDLAVRLIEKFELPLWRPMAHEPWHFELVGSRP
ncbi:MAG: D-alanyl-D-alanine carboxypeptidase family protein [Actinomycetota bacterium]|nr:D-alanyl-D-alanine carboxypeptidase family protein [Actinomycetota bacterium]